MFNNLQYFFCLLRTTCKSILGGDQIWEKHKGGPELTKPAGGASMLGQNSEKNRMYSIYGAPDLANFWRGGTNIWHSKLKIAPPPTHAFTHTFNGKSLEYFCVTSYTPVRLGKIIFTLDH